MKFDQEIDVDELIELQNRNGKDASATEETLDMEDGQQFFSGKQKLVDGKTMCSLEFQNVAYSVKTPDPDNKNAQIRKQIIHPATGSISHSRMTAIMGSSGAGKSTLLDILSGRLSTKARQGRVTVNGKAVNPNIFRKLSGYVMQEDALLPIFTVRETLRYAAFLRLPRAEFSAQDIERRVDEVLEMLDLTEAADTLIGNDLIRGVSGGQKRRVSIGVDIIHSPSIIFLDEPTSGLDSATALQVVSVLKQLAMGGRTIVVTVHQPSRRMWECFDDILFLHAGHILYHGPCQAVVHHMESKAISIPQYVNIPEFFLETVNEYAKEGKLQALLETRGEKQVRLSSGRSETKSSDTKDDNNATDTFMYPNSLWEETRILMMRGLHTLLRTKELFLVRIALSIVFGLVMGSLFFDASKANEKAGFVVFGVAFFLFTSLEALPFFMHERIVFTRESSRGSYRPASYALASSLIGIPFQALPAVLFVAISYYMVGLEASVGSFFMYCLGQICVLLCGNAQAMLVSTLTNDPVLGTTAGTAVFAFYFLFSGFFIPRNDIPGYWIWMHYLSTFNWGFETLAISGFDKGNPQELALMKQYGIADGSAWRGIVILLGMTVALRILFYLVLKYKHSGVRHK